MGLTRTEIGAIAKASQSNQDLYNRLLMANGQVNIVWSKGGSTVQVYVYFDALNIGFVFASDGAAMTDQGETAFGLGEIRAHFSDEKEKQQ